MRFWRLVAASLDDAIGDSFGILESVDESTREESKLHDEAVVTALINAIPADGGDAALVLDDYQAIENETIHNSVRYLLQHAPPGLHIAIASRADPPLRLARLRALGRLTEIRAADLRFTTSEAGELLRHIAGTDITDGVATLLTTRTEGWAAGLHLAGLSLEGRDDAESFVEGFSGSHRFVLDYLTEEVLDRQPAAIRDFLLETSILDRLSAPLADAVTGRTDGQETLEAIERANLFLIPLDDVRHWWRYHHLFADLLRVRFQQQTPERVRERHRRAATWHDEHGLADQAVRYALKANDPDLATQVIERHADALLLRSEGATWDWFADLPPELLGSRRLLLARARVALYAGRVAEAEGLLDSEPSIDGGTGSMDSFGLNVALLRAFAAHLRGDADRAEALASLTYNAAGDDQPTLGLVAELHLAVAPWLRGAVADAEPALTTGIARWRATQGDDRAAWTVQYLGDIQRARGQLDDALGTYQDVLAYESTQPRPDALASGVAHIGTAEVAYQRNELEIARQHAGEGIDRCRQFVHTQILSTGLDTQAFVHQAMGDHAAARDLIDEAIRVRPSTDVVDLLNPVPARRARLLLAQGDVDGANAWVVTRGVAADDEPRHVHEPAYLVLARVLSAQDRSGEALRLLDRMRAAATNDRRFGRLIEIDVLRALALAADDEVGARRALAAAVDLAAPQRHIRVFVDEGQRVGELLGQLLADPDAQSLPQDYLGELIRSFDDDPANSKPPLQDQEGLIIPLTVRELDVIRLIAAGRQNKEIAAELYVSLNTVKKHVTHIFDKLGVTNRTAATARARELNLLT
ncbi:MAG: LuxR C-terminal-related transcriptional regulator [Acidimicrobiia bacterium]|nr:LuxR C-terminal-related transcriptional regulator [Acidimicrobiia bacterium]